MTFACEDLRDYGVALVPPSSPDYQPLFDDIQRRIDTPPGSEATLSTVRERLTGKISGVNQQISAILLNRSQQPIAALALFWRFDEIVTRRTREGIPSSERRISMSSHRMTFGRVALLPFSIFGASQKVHGYWHLILPGSKRYLACGEMAGDNTDVRLPEGDEIWKGGAIGFVQRADQRNLDRVISATLVLDGVFFADGSFAGANELGLWEQVTDEAFGRLAIAQIAREGKEGHLSPVAILERISAMTGVAPDNTSPPAPPPPPRPGKLRDPMEREAYMMRMLGTNLAIERRSRGDDAVIDRLASEADTILPDFRKL